MQNQILPESVRYFCDVISRLKQAGAAGIILGCTEICLIVNEENSPLPVFDITQIHALAAVDEALAG
ncbi:aspartate/glutamate racemase family protein [Neisseria elongata]|uniref:aspartate/glutamate racemase family protein n=1 Tax=Neisseria elongata TaxID=495 RepID=UPI0031FEA9EE